jgi:LytS/YehU family sensor histidine kinase
MPKNTLYWICQIFGWAIYAVLLLSLIYIFGGSGAFTTDVIIVQVIIYVALIVFSHLFRIYIKRNNWISFSIGKVAARAAIGALITTVAAQALIHIVLYVLAPLIQPLSIQPFSWTSFLGYVFNVFLIMSLWTAIYLGVIYSRKNRKNEIEKLELRAALQEAELAILKNQVNPHFLFNALNNIRSLILSDPDRAREMVTHISELLRYSIQFNAAEKVSLKQELDIVKDYLILESIQFNNRLSYDFEIEEEALNVKIPPMAIQLLVENAIKHGISQLATGGNIDIRARLTDGHLKIQVSNKGQLKKTSKREGIGLKNLIERLQILFGQFAELKVENSNDETVTATLKIPLS